MEFSRRSLLTAGTLLALPAAAVSARELGIEPNSNKDQSKSMQAAIDAAAKQGGTLVLEAGKYLVSGLRLRRGVAIAGVPGRTLLIDRSGGPILTGGDVKHLRLAGLTFDGMGLKPEGQGLVALSDAEGLGIEDCSFIGSAGTGLSLTRCSGRIIASRFSFLGQTGVFALDSKGLVISGNTVRDIGNNGIQVWATEPREDGTIVAENHVMRVAAKDGGSGQNGNGINVWKAGNVAIAQNRVSDCAFSAIRNNSGANCQIVNNNISRTDEVAIYVEFAFQGAVVSGNVIDDICFGISITNLDQGGRLAVCANNLIRNARGGRSEGVTRAGGIYAEADTTVSGNVIEDARDVGIALGWGKYSRNLMAAGNLIRNCGRGVTISMAQGAEPAVVANNMIVGAKEGAVFGMDHTETITADLAAAGAKAPDLVRLSGNTIL
ncbi:MAG: TIGR03808 family TAT-translocated repetitive protein [Rhizobiales bacterium]|nr:TIGR03808 family TAT-translocated repetitive protein [Hyphomicrobiales bacterium]